MSPNRRIFLNIVATYGRSLYALVIGLFCGRWTLMALGEVDYGLFGVVAGMVGFLGFLNGIMSGAVGRFFSVAIGEESTNYEQGLEKCRRFFAAALVGNSVLPLLVVSIGYPLGIWCVQNVLNMPTERIAACMWVWRFVIISFAVNSIVVPFNAIYGAKQYIAELTVYSFITTTLNVLFAYYMISHPGDWLAKYACWTCFVSVVPSIVIAVRAYWLFPECRFSCRYLLCVGQLKEMISFSFWNLISWLGGVLAIQGCSVMINRHFGPVANAGVNVGNSLSGHTQTLTGSLIGAFSPAIMNAYGAGDLRRMSFLITGVNKIGVICILIFAIPLSIEVDEVLHLWLKTPPLYAAGCCELALLHAVVDKFSIGYLIGINAKGNIARFQLFVGSTWLFVLPVAYVFVLMGLGVYSALIALVIGRVYVVFSRVWFARKLLNADMTSWLKSVFFPLLFVIAVSWFAGYFATYRFAPSFGRICLTTLVVEIVLLPLAWFVVLNSLERSSVLCRVRRFFLSRR